MAVPGVGPRLSSSPVTLTVVLFYPSYVVFRLGMTCATSYGCSFIQNPLMELGARVWGPTEGVSGMQDLLLKLGNLSEPNYGPEALSPNACHIGV